MADPIHPYLRKLIRKRSRKQEVTTAKQIGGRRQPASGSLPHYALKEDVSAKHFLVSNKTTERGSYSIKHAELQILEERALTLNKCPLLQTDINGERWVTMRWDDFRQIAHDAGML